jgi:hypothetical protein
VRFVGNIETDPKGMGYVDCIMRFTMDAWKHDNEHASTIKGRTFLDYLSD